MKQFYLLFILLPTFCFCQKKKNINLISEDSVINKWTRASINIETRLSYRKFLAPYEKQEFEGIISRDSLWKIEDSLKFIGRRTGTMIFLEDKGKHFLLTAKHVVIDTSSTRENASYRNYMLIENFTSYKFTNDPIVGDQFGNIYSFNHNFISFIIYDGDIRFRNFHFTDDSDDLAIVYLDSSIIGQQIIDGLYERGYRPIHISDIDTICKIKKNDEIYAIGYPQESIVANQNLPRAIFNWSSNLISLPVISKGKTIVSEDKKHTFEANIFTYFGNSGGPIVRNNKLIGIVSGFYLDTFNIYNTGRLLSGYIKYRPKFVKSSLLMSLYKDMQVRGMLLPGEERYKFNR